AARCGPGRDAARPWGAGSPVSSGERSRTSLLVQSQPAPAANVLPHKAVVSRPPEPCVSLASDAASVHGFTLPADLARVVAVRDGLPPHIRLAVQALIDAATR